MKNGWHGVDLDGTLALYDGWQGVDHIGEPVPKMLARVKAWLEAGEEVRIVTARVYCPEDGDPRVTAGVRETIDRWCVRHVGVRLPVTCTKDFAMIDLWDDRAVQVIPNTGDRADGLE